MSSNLARRADDHEHRGFSNFYGAKHPASQRDRIAWMPLGNGTLERRRIGRTFREEAERLEQRTLGGAQAP